MTSGCVLQQDCMLQAWNTRAPCHAGTNTPSCCAGEAASITADHKAQPVPRVSGSMAKLSLTALDILCTKNSPTTDRNTAMNNIIRRVSTLPGRVETLLPVVDARGCLSGVGLLSLICRTTRLLVLRRFESGERVVVVCRFWVLMAVA